MAKYTVRFRDNKYKVIYEDFWERTELKGMSFNDIDQALTAAERLQKLEKYK